MALDWDAAGVWEIVLTTPAKAPAAGAAKPGGAADSGNRNMVEPQRSGDSRRQIASGKQPKATLRPSRIQACRRLSAGRRGLHQRWLGLPARRPGLTDSGLEARATVGGSLTRRLRPERSPTILVPSAEAFSDNNTHNYWCGLLLQLLSGKSAGCWPVEPFRHCAGLAVA